MNPVKRAYSIASAVARRLGRRFGVSGHSTSWKTSRGQLTIDQVRGDATINTCCLLVAAIIAQLKFRAPENPDIDRLLRRPNSWQAPFSWMFSIVYDLMLHGNAFVRVFRTEQSREVLELAPLDARYVKVWDVEGQPRYSATSAGQKLGPQDVIHFRDVPTTTIESPARHELGEERIATLLESDAFLWRTFKHGPNVRGFISAPNKIDDAVRQRFDAAQERFLGGGERAGGFMLLEGGATVHSLDMPIVDASVIDGREKLKTEVASLYGVPPFLAGVSEGNVKYSNQTAQHSAFYRDGLSPRVTNIRETLAVFFGLDAETGIVCDLEELLVGDFPSLVKTAKEAVAGMLKTPNEGRAMLGDPPLDDEAADKLQYGGGAADTGSMDPNRPRAGEEEEGEGE